MKTKLKKLISILVVISMILVLFVGCSGNNDEEVDQEVSKDSLVVALGYDASSLDPTDANDVPSGTVNSHIYESLVTIGDDGSIKPQLAESFEQIDSVTYEFKLKEGIKFHNGEELKASDVKFTFERGMEKGKIASTVGQIDETSFDIKNDYTISFKIKAPNTSFLSAVGRNTIGIVNEKAVNESGEQYAMNPVGTGPFEFVSWKKGDIIELKRYEEYHGEKPAYKNLTFRIIPESNNRVIELESGGVDIALDISPNDVERIKEHEDLVMYQRTDLSASYLGFQTQKEPYNDPRVRQAIAYAIDIPTIVDSVWRGVATVATTPMSSQQKYFNEDIKIREKNIEKSKELLKEAGFPDGFKATLWTHEHSQRIDIATLIQSELKEVGIDLDVQVIEWGTFLSGLYAGEHEMCILGFFSGVQDPHESLYQVFHSSLLGPKGNMCYYANDRVDELLDEGKGMPDSDAREEVYHELQEILVEDSPWIPLYNGQQLIGANKIIKNFQPHISGTHLFIDVTF